jgi:winged helix DNA-binding protein
VPRRPALTDDRLRRLRVAAQHLHHPRRRSAVDLVRHLTGVQAQILSAAGLALRARTAGLTLARVDRARLRDRSIVCTWAMRGTLHLIAAEDHGWLPPLVLERQLDRSRRRLRQMGMTGDEPDRAVRAIERILVREGPRTRAELAERLQRRGFRMKEWPISYHLLLLASAGGGVCPGPDRGRDRTFVPVRDWIGETRTIDRDAALAELAVRYLAAHGPAEPADLAFWSGIRMADARRAWGAVEDRLVEVHAGPNRTLWMLKRRKADAPGGVVRLLPSFDEYLLGWKDRGSIAGRDGWRKINPGAGWYHPAVLVDGRGAGTWKTERRSDIVSIQVEPFSELTPSGRKGIADEAADVGRYLGADSEVTFRRR